MADRQSGDQWTRVTGVGSVVVANRNVTLRRIILPGTFVGSVEFYDSATVAGTAAGNNIFNVALPVLQQWNTIDVNANCKDGLVYAASGTPTLTFTWD